MISLIQTAEGALNETHAILQRMRELAVQSANDTNNDKDRGALQDEMDQLAEEISRISDNTEFNTKNLFGESGFDGKFHIGANSGQSISVSINEMSATSLSVGTEYTAGTGTLSGNSKTYTHFAKDADLDGSGSGTATASVAGYYDASGNLFMEASTALASGETVLKGIDVSSQSGANTAITTINSAIESVSSERSKLGAIQNRLEHTINNLGTSAENLTAAESRIRDVDYDLAAA